MSRMRYWPPGGRRPPPTPALLPGPPPGMVLHSELVVYDQGSCYIGCLCDWRSAPVSGPSSTRPSPEFQEHLMEVDRERGA